MVFAILKCILLSENGCINVLVMILTTLPILYKLNLPSIIIYNDLLWEEADVPEENPTHTGRTCELHTV